MKRVTEDMANKMYSLRRRGFSMPEISRKLLVSKSTAFRYVRDVEILPKYLYLWSSKRGGSSKKKALKEKQSFQEGLKIVGNLTTKDKWLVLSILYWAEGSKKDFGLINSNPDIIKIFVCEIRDLLKLGNDSIKVSIRIYEGINEQEALSYWSKLLNIPKEEFGRTDVLLGMKVGKLPYGVCRVRVLKGGDYLKKIMGINRAVSKQFVPIAQLDRASRS